MNSLKFVFRILGSPVTGLGALCLSLQGCNGASNGSFLNVNDLVNNATTAPAGPTLDPNLTISASSSPYAFIAGDVVSISPTLGSSVTRVSIAPALSNGLSLNATTGVIQGTVTGTLASQVFTLTASNSSGQTATTSFTMQVYPVSNARVMNVSQQVTKTAGSLSFQIGLDSPSPRPMTIPYTLTGEAAISSYTNSPLSGTVTIAAGQTSFTQSIPLLNDGLTGSEKRLFFNLQPPTSSGARLGLQRQATAHILDSNQALPTVMTTSYHKMGANHSCAVLSNGSLRCWGNNYFGQIGINVSAIPIPQDPVTIISSGVSQVALGQTNTCAVLSTGALQCWGNNDNGQIGDNTVQQRNVPQLTLSSGVSQVALGNHDACAVLSSGALQCWGYNSNGQLGDNTTTERHVPVTVISAGVSQVALGYTHSCAVLSTGALQCWGLNTSGQLGDGTTTQRNTPVTVIPSGVASVDLGDYHTCAVLTNGALQCWGNNNYGQLGDNTNTQRISPVTTFSGGISQVSLGSNHSCAKNTSGGIQCWGFNSNGQYGNGGTATQYSPQVSLTSGVLQVMVGSNHTCVILSGGTLQCWGNNPNKELGNATAAQFLSPQSLVASGVSQVTASGYSTCITLTSGAIQCTGSNGFSAVNDGTNTNRFSFVPSNLPTGVSQLVLGDGNQNCMILASGALQCWGLNDAGQLGINSTGYAFSTRNVVIPSGVIQVAAGARNTCAVLATGELRCWGQNQNGEVGDNSTTRRNAPVSIFSSGVSQVAMGGSHTCALLTTGGVQCWGRGDSGQLGNGSNVGSLAPVQVSGLTSGVAQLAGGGFHTCALLSSGSVQCWGLGNAGQLGNNASTQQNTPVQAYGLTSGATQIAAGGYSTYAVVGGAYMGWGYDYNGQLGNGLADHAQGVTIPTVIIPSGVSKVASSPGSYSAYAVMSSGELKGWGWNTGGQLGLGATSGEAFFYNLPDFVFQLTNP